MYHHSYNPHTYNPHTNSFAMPVKECDLACKQPFGKPQHVRHPACLRRQLR